MSSSDLAISVRGIGKSYTIRHNQPAHTTLAESIAQRLRHPLRRASGRETFWALSDVSFDVKKGEVVGIIGRNGAGKSTLLKILSRITEPTTGQIDLYGRVGSLLEVGTGFHQELTGRENIFLNGAILGMSRAEIRKQFDAIVDFAGVEKFLDTPVKRYSSGMYVRLAFAVAAHLRSEILIVDEVLAVGDAEFQKKCLGKMKEVSTDGRTVLFVSHNMPSIRSLCHTGLMLRDGSVVAAGTVENCIAQYGAAISSLTKISSSTRPRPGQGQYRFTKVSTAREFRPDEAKEVEFEVRRFGADVGPMSIEMFVMSQDNQIVAQCDSRVWGCYFPDADRFAGAFNLRSPWLQPGRYRVRMVIAANSWIDVWEDACEIVVSADLPYTCATSTETYARQVVLADFGLERCTSLPVAKPLRSDAQTQSLESPS